MQWFTILDYGESQGTVSRLLTATAKRLSEPCQKRHHAVNELNQSNTRGKHSKNITLTITCDLDRNLHLLIKPLMTPLLGNVVENKKNRPTNIQEQYEDAYRVWINDCYRHRSAMEVDKSV